MVGNLKENYQKINNIITAELNNDSQLKPPNIVAVSKRQSVSKIRELFEQGQRHFGENYLQEALEKQDALKDLQIIWHYIGNIQSKKIKDLVGNFDLIHTLSRLSEAEKISKVAAQKGLTQKVLIQVNIANEESKQGVSTLEISELAKRINLLPHIILQGLMVFPPLSDNEQDSLRWYEKAKKLFIELQSQLGPQFLRLSMGTSHDFHLALRNGATDLRIGERLMGPRDRAN